MTMRRDIPPLRLLATFETVLRKGGVQNAAAELNVTQPAVSQALRSLEDHVGAPLLHRRVRPAAPTEAGRILFHAVSEGISRIGQAMDEIKAMENKERNVVTVACTVCIGTYWLMPRLASFYSRHSDVTVRVVTSSGMPEFAPDTDLVIRFGAGNWADGRSELLFGERLVPVCNPQAIARFGDGDLEKAPLLHVEGGDNCWPGWPDYFEAVGLSGTRQADRSFSNYVEATQAAIAGMGVMLGWISNTGDLVKEGRLAVFRDQPLLPAGGYHLVRPLRRREKEASALLESHLRGCVDVL